MPRCRTPGALVVSAGAESRAVDEGQVIFRQGDEDGFVHCLLDGELELLWNGKHARRLVAGGNAARRALDPPGRKRHTVTALTRARINRPARSRLEHALQFAELADAPKALEVSEIATGKSSNGMIRTTN